MESNVDLIDHKKKVKIDNQKEELNYIKKKINLYRCSEVEFENEMVVVEFENKNAEKELDKTKKEMIEVRDRLRELECL